MSLNHKEIDLVLSELDLKNSIIREVLQPTPPELILELYKPQKNLKLYISLAEQQCRMHLLTKKIKKRPKPLRFVLFLRSHIKNSRIIDLYQIDSERIIRIVIMRAKKPATSKNIEDWAKNNRSQPIRP